MPDRPFPPLSIRRRDLLIAVGLVAMVAAVYWPVYRFEFVRFDDPLFLSENPHAAQGLTVASAKWAVTSFVMSNYMPMSALSALLDIRLWGMHAGALHVVNAVLHSISTVEWFFLWVMLTGKRARSFCVAAVFALHPMHVEPVAWISCRGDMLCMVFSVAVLLAYVRYVRTGGKRLFAIAITFYGLAILSKTVAMALPGVMILLNVWPLRNGDGSSRTQRHLMKELSPFFALAVAAAGLGLWGRYATAAVSNTSRWTLTNRLLNGFLAYGSYVVKAIWPEPMRAIYTRDMNFNVASALAAAVLLAMLTLVAVRSRRRRPYLFVGWLWFLGCALPTIGIVQSGPQAMADRYTYLPYVGLSVAAIWTGAELIRSVAFLGKVAQPIAGTTAAIMLLACGIDARQQLQTWRNSLALYTHASQFAPDDPIINNALGTEYRLAGRPDIAVQFCARAVAVLPGNADMQSNFGRVLLEIDPKQAISHFRIAATADATAEQWSLLGFAQQQAGQIAAATASYRQALRIDPSFAPATAALSALPPTP